MRDAAEQPGQRGKEDAFKPTTTSIHRHHGDVASPIRTNSKREFVQGVVKTVIMVYGADSLFQESNEYLKKGFLKNLNCKDLYQSQKGRNPFKKSSCHRI